MGKTLIVDDDEDMRLLLRIMINGANHGLEVVGQAATGEEALVLHRDLDLDVIVLDQQMPGLSGVETAERLLAEDPDMPIVLYSAFLDPDVRQRAARVGIRQCVTKGDVPTLIGALRVLTGMHINDPSD
jgi:DNA-binding NarL/FixJ family response regulator